MIQQLSDPLCVNVVAGSTFKRYNIKTSLSIGDSDYGTTFYFEENGNFISLIVFRIYLLELEKWPIFWKMPLKTDKDGLESAQL